MTDVNLSNYVYYDETSPSGLRWKVDRWGGHKYATKAVSAGDVAGALSHGYWRTVIEGEVYQNHRAICMLFDHDIEGLIVDHVDGNQGNNIYSNLRICDHSVNMQNLKMYANNSSGTAGVGWKASKRGKLTGTIKTYAGCHWNENGEQGCKYFPVDDYGLLPAFAKAAAYRQAQIERLNSQGGSYTERHGKRLPA